MLVSAVITTYGRSFEQIERSILSVKSQSYQPIEIILVDDNPPDSDARSSISQGVSSHPDILYVKHSHNMGAQQARNTGIERASGAYIAFLDDDDEWLPEKIEKQVAAVKEGVGLVYCKGFKVTEETGEVSNYYNATCFSQHATMKDLLYKDIIGTTSQALIPRNVFTRVGLFDLSLPARQDYEMWIRISEFYDCVGVDEPLFRHYIHSGEQISKSTAKVITARYLIFRKYRKQFRQYPRLSVRFPYYIGIKCWNAGMPVKAFRFFAVAFFEALVVSPKWLRQHFRLPS